MDKFSKLDRQTGKIKEDTQDFKYYDEHVKILDFEDWTIIEDRDAAVCIPYLIERNQIIVRSEYIPSYKYKDGQEYHLALIGGGIEKGETPNQAMIRELEEEGGIKLREDFNLEGLKPLFISKGHANKYYPYIIELTEADYDLVTATGDGSKVEKMSKPISIDAKQIHNLIPSDVITAYMIEVMKKYLTGQ